MKLPSTGLHLRSPSWTASPFFFPPDSPGSTAFINHLHLNPHLRIHFRGPQPRIMLTLHPAPKMTKVGVGRKAVISPRIKEMRLVNAS